MQNMENILKVYRLADFERRLYLFLEFREHREMFTEIDESEYLFANRLQEGKQTVSWWSKVKRFFVLKWLPG